MDRVSVICISYNHAQYVQQAMQSVLDQDYPEIELIVADDASTDGSSEVIEDFLSSNPDVQFLKNEQNIGNCSTFNKALKKATGAYVLDLAADDTLAPERISEGVQRLQDAGPEYGVHYCDAWLVDENNTLLGEHSQSTRNISKNPFPEGDLFAEILARYFICPPTIMARRSVFESLDGYDESLSYEDFDFLVRSSRRWQFCVTPLPLVLRRVLTNSKSNVQPEAVSYFESTLKVCQKAFDLAKTDLERKALKKRLLFEGRQALRRGHGQVVDGYLNLLTALGYSPMAIALMKLAKRIHT